MTGRKDVRDDGFTGQAPTGGSGGAKLDDPAFAKGSSSGGSEGEGAGGANDCDISQRAPLNTPVPSVVTTLSVGQLLDVDLVLSGQRSILEVRKAGVVAGALTHRGHLDLIRCIENGWTYKAVVINISGGHVELRIQSA